MRKEENFTFLSIVIILFSCNECIIYYYTYKIDPRLITISLDDVTDEKTTTYLFTLASIASIVFRETQSCITMIRSSA